MVSDYQHKLEKLDLERHQPKWKSITTTKMVGCGHRPDMWYTEHTIERVEEWYILITLNKKISFVTIQFSWLHRNSQYDLVIIIIIINANYSLSKAASHKLLHQHSSGQMKPDMVCSIIYTTSSCKLNLPIGRQTKERK